MSIELSVTCKDCERTLKKDYLLYDQVTLTENDPIIDKCIKESLKEFNGEPEDIKVRAVLIIR